jgi:hypothetical protein
MGFNSGLKELRSKEYKILIVTFVDIFIKIIFFLNL